MNEPLADSAIPADWDDLREYLVANRNWGRWGEDDQRGAINLIDDEKRKRSSALVRSGRAVSLSRPVPVSPAPNNPTPAQHYMTWTAPGERGPDAGSIRDFYGFDYHGQVTTHIDAMCHVWHEAMWNGRSAAEMITPKGSHWGSIDHWSSGIFTRGILLNVPKFRNELYVTREKPVREDDLRGAIEQAGIEPEPGDALIIYCGRDMWEKEHPPWSSEVTRPGLDASCLRVIRETDCSVVLWDMWDARPKPYPMPFGPHAALFLFGTAVVDAPELGPLLEACRQEQRSDFLLTINPLVVKGGSGSPVNPVAIF